jgi:hypothetical protein
MTKRADYYHVTDGEWIRVPKRGYKEQCCDCGLVHKLNFRVVGGQIEIQTSRDERATSAVRRAFKFEKD